MKRASSPIAFLVVACLFLPMAAHAQAFRTYLASYGNDGNAGCTVTAPCRLLPAALNAVLDKGEVWILDSANFNAGTVNITKSVSILAVPGEIASIAAVAGAPAINISTPAVTVALRNIVIPRNANNPGTRGIEMTNGAILSVEDCLFANLSADAIYVHGVNALVSVKNSVFRNIAGYSVRAENGPNVSVTNSQMLFASGILAYSSSAISTIASVTDSTISDGGEGLFAYTNAAGGVAKIFVTRSTLHNVFYALDAETNGLGTAAIYAGGNMVDGSLNGWYQSGTGSSVVSYGNNQFSGSSGNLGSMTFNSLQ